MDDVKSSHSGANGAESKMTLTICLVKFARWRNRGRSSLSTIAFVAIFAVNVVVPSLYFKFLL